MKKFLLYIITLATFPNAAAQYDNIFHEAVFGKFKGVMRSEAYKVDDWEKGLFENSEKAVFPTDAKQTPEVFAGKLIHWIGIVQDIDISPNDAASSVTILLENKYWDYVEDYSIQDEVMFVSPMGDGQFGVVVDSINLSYDEIEYLKKFPINKKLLLCYGILLPGKEGDVPILAAQGLKIVDYKLYSTKIFSYEIQRDEKNRVVKSNSGTPVIVNFKTLRVARRGQNK